VRIPTLGLRPATTYKQAVELVTAGRTVRSDSVVFTTGTPPSIVSDMHLVWTTGAPGQGYTVLSPISLSNDTAVIVAFDSTGSVRWYRLFAEGVPLAFAQQMPNGNYAAFLGSSQGWQPTYGRFVEVAPDGAVVHEYVASTPFYTDAHEIVFTLRDATVTAVSLFGYELRPTDLSSLGGPANALVAGHMILRLGTDGQVQFMWNAWDHFGIADWIEPTGVNPPLDFDHPNSLDYDLDNNYIASFRHMGLVAKIDARTGNIVWRLGGRTNQFTFLNDPLGGFSGQHSVRVLPNGNVLMYDNGLRHAPPESRAVEYHLDTNAMTATMVWEFRHNAPLFTFAVGSVQRYSNGNTLVGFGFVGIVTDVDPSGAVQWEGQLMFGQAKGLFYRAQGIKSLYEYVTP
jgi:arylsulfotransferase ASST